MTPIPPINYSSLALDMYLDACRASQDLAHGVDRGLELRVLRTALAYQAKLTLAARLL